jgi:hypothetical protein
MSERAAYWRRVLGAWEQSGLSQAEFCRRRGIKAVNLAWWKRRLRGAEDTSGGRRGRRASSTGRTGVVDVALRRGPASATSLGAAAIIPASDRYEIALPGGVGLRLPDDFDPERVARLVQALAAAC